MQFLIYFRKKDVIIMTFCDSQVMTNGPSYEQFDLFQKKKISSS